MIIDALYPLLFETPSLPVGTENYLEDSGIQLLVDFFRQKGIHALKSEDQQECWYADWIEYQSTHGIYAGILSPKKYSSLGHQFRLANLTRLWEAFAYFSPAHAYSLHTSFLGLFPILMSSNEELKEEAISRLEAGGLFSFGISERAHGSDLFANEFAVRVEADGWLANGAKYYIGNANAACMISILAKRVDAATAGITKRAPFLLFALRPKDAPALKNVRKIRTLGIKTAFVGEFEVHNHRFPDRDIIAQGRDAWDAVLGTVNFGKFFLGFGAVGICAHAFAEAFAHLRKRILYGKSVIEMPHIRATTAAAFARLCAMKFYAFRALDYLQISCDNDRRYLLFNAVQKARVSTEGVKVTALLSECIGAKGFETETFFESAIRDGLLIPGLEGSTHINFSLIAHFLDNYFSGSGHDLPIPESIILRSMDAGENPYWMDARDRNAKSVRFAPCLAAFEPLRSLPNVELFATQIMAFRSFASDGIPTINPGVDVAQAIAIGTCLSIIVYGQLVAENCHSAGILRPLVSMIFRELVEDLSAESLKLAAKLPSESIRESLRRVVQVAAGDNRDIDAVSDFLLTRYNA